ncbi:hypothetical protein [Alteromonas sp. C1M14]|uniref:hypothetical protein n=1 Tax=Alteromonas sp. C1M14 TaxID=2841567 RepID=UPI001C0909FF|nr:hypothetical protein [Alteromonas sp. C1M14]MBU2977931.1 hypothetical protein [Alteromonas sp. C1M14]
MKQEKFLKLQAIHRISGRASHAAFTDLTYYQDQLLCCYRIASNHISGDGHIEIARLTPQAKVVQRERIHLPNADLRDPKLSVDGNGRLWLMAFARFRAVDNQHGYTKMLSWFSDNGLSWSSAHPFGDNHWWLWRIAWLDNQAFGLAYHRPLQQLDLCIGHPHRQMFRQSKPAMSLKRDNLGYPNESALLFGKRKEIYGLVRRDADTFSAQLGVSKPPYTSWHWQDLNTYIGGPAMIRLTEKSALVAGRNWTGCEFKTQLWLLDLDTAKLTPLYTLPSAKDNSYPGLVIQGDILYVSYYSGHCDNQTRVYLACITGIKKLCNIIEQGKV